MIIQSSSDRGIALTKDAGMKARGGKYGRDGDERARARTTVYVALATDETRGERGDDEARQHQCQHRATCIKELNIQRPRSSGYMYSAS